MGHKPQRQTRSPSCAPFRKKPEFRIVETPEAQQKRRRAHGLGLTAKLARHVRGLRFEDLPPEVIEKAKDCILDQIGVELIGSTLEWNKIAYR